MAVATETTMSAVLFVRIYKTIGPALQAKRLVSCQIENSWLQDMQFSGTSPMYRIKVILPAHLILITGFSCGAGVGGIEGTLFPCLSDIY